MTTVSVGIAVITHRSKDHLDRCLPPLIRSPLAPRVLVVNSSSGDGTVERAEELGAETLVVPRREFNHGTTRDVARRHLGTDVVVMMTPDAYPRDGAVERLVVPVLRGDAALAYGRQVARRGAGFFETFARSFSYPSESHVRAIGDADRFGAYLTFCSDAFAAYSNSALDEIGGFRRVLSHEDAIAAAMLLRHGQRIAYVAEAVVEHSHRSSLRSEFKRYFDAGHARDEFREALSVAGSHAGLGMRYVSELVHELVRSRPWLLPYAAFHVAARGLGYWTGKRSARAPIWLNRRLSGQDYYWASAPPAPEARPGTAEG